ncbi:MAG: M36 family metallopeptidase [Nocardioidaceae bacterium]|nr:M36 family metallopeptidase [Nocardioidaceae bacterium]
MYLSASCRLRNTATPLAVLALIATLPAGTAGVAGAQQTRAQVIAPVSGTERTHFTAVPTAKQARTTVAVPGNVRRYRVRTSLTARHEWFRQVKEGRAVFNGWWARHTDLKSGAVTIWDGRQDVHGRVANVAAVAAERADLVTQKAAGTSSAATQGSHLVVLPDASGEGAPRLTWAVHTATGQGATLTFVDAENADVLHVVEIAHRLDQATPTKAGAYSVRGRGRVFDPNPSAKLQRQDLRDRNDSNAAVPSAAYTIVDLPRLNSQHTLVGKWVRITNRRRATSPENRYLYRRDGRRFEQVNAYHALDALQHYLQRLGFRDVNSESQKIEVNAFADDNSYYDEQNDKISTGTGGVDDAEDVEVLWHEYGHAIQSDQVPGFGFAGQTGAIGEGFGDYIAATMSQANTRTTTKVPTACVADWDATSYDPTTPHCLRRTDTNKHYPEDLTGEVHADGKIWSRALWDMNAVFGRANATTIIVESHFSMSPAVTMPRAARTTVDTARRLYPGSGIATQTRHIFVRRGILLPLS